MTTTITTTTTATLQRSRTLTGLKPTGRLQLGNLLGAIRPMVQAQESSESIVMIVDLHALTVEHDPQRVRELTLEQAGVLLACGVDPARTTIYVQSHLSEHAQLHYLLECTTGFGEARRMIQFREGMSGPDPVRLSLLTYPVLMAADILLFDSNVVPVGRDQKQHVEVTRDIANIFNRLYKSDIFVIPAPSILPAVATIPGLDGQKMSKSYGNTIELFEEENALRKKVTGIITDSTPVEQPKDPSKSSILGLYRLVADKDDIAEMEEEFRIGGVGYGDFKKRLFAVLWEYFAPFRRRRSELASDSSHLDRVLANGAQRARAVAEQTMKRVRAAVGISQ